MLDRESFSATMLAVQEAYGVELSPPALDCYWVALRDLSTEEFELGCQGALKRKQWMPKPAEIRGFAEGELTALAEQAWFDFIARFRRYGASRALHCPTITWKAIRSMGGLGGLGRQKSSDFAARGKREFMSAWRHYWEEELAELEERRQVAEEEGRPPPKRERDSGQTLAGAFGTENPVRLPLRNKELAKRTLTSSASRSDTPARGNLISLCG